MQAHASAGVVKLRAMSLGLDRVIVLHGYLSNPADNWFGWLKDELEASGIAVEVPALPQSDAPELEPWVATAVAAIGRPDERTGIVGHSLGAVTALHALDRIGGDWALGALIAVSGFVEVSPELPELAAFTATRPDLERTAARTRSRVAVLSDNDYLVPPSLSRDLGAALGAEIVTVPDAGHFIVADGVTSLPLVADLLRRG